MRHTRHVRNGLVADYAIMLSFQKMSNTDFSVLLQDKKYKRSALKIRRTCEVALLEHGLEYVWIDMCCINKWNEVELNESIRSMFQWYERAGMGITYLEDVEDASLTSNVISIDGKPQKGRWFSRGWTLQELLAPKKMVFYGAQWQRLGIRQQLSEHIKAAAKIPAKYFNDYKSESCDASVAMKMSWASGRTTTHSEDMA